MLPSRIPTHLRRLAVVAVLGLTGALTACGDDDATTASPTATAPAASAPAAKLDKKTDTAATAAAASADKVSAADLESQSAAIEEGLKSAGFSPSNLGEVGEAKADIVVDTSWAVYVYESDRAAAEFAVSLAEIREGPGNYELFRIDNRVYYVSMTTALSDADREKLDAIATAAEGAVAAG